MMESKGLRFCGEIFRAGDYQHYLCSLLLPPSLGKMQWYLGALNVETARIKLISKNPTIQLARLQFWKSALISEEKVENPVVLGLRQYIKDSQLNRMRLQKFISARERDISKGAYYTLEEIESYCEETYSNLLYILLKEGKLDMLESEHAASHLAKSMGIVAFLKGILPLAHKGLDPGIPIDLLSLHRISQSQLLEDTSIWNGEDMKNIIHSMADRAWLHLLHAQKHFQQASNLTSNSGNKKTLRAIFLPIIVARKYLEVLQKADFTISDKELYRKDGWLFAKLLFSYYSGKPFISVDSSKHKLENCQHS